MQSRQLLHIKFSTSPELSRAVFEFVQNILSHLTMDDEVRRKFMLATGEAIDNAIIHGNKFSPTKMVQLELTHEPGKISLSVQDEGSGFDYAKHLGISLIEFEAPKLIEKTLKYGSPGGLGIALIRKCINELIYTPPGNKITLIKYLA